MGATFRFRLLREDETLRLGRCEIRLLRQHHPDTSYSYRVDDGRTVVVYASDAEYCDLDEGNLRRYVEFFRDADALIFDAQYSLRDVLFEKDGWGHSTAFIGIDLAGHAGVRRLILFHHEPAYNDRALVELLETARLYKAQDPQQPSFEILLAYEGLTLEL